LNEIAIFHKSSGMLLLCDMTMNLKEDTVQLLDHSKKPISLIYGRISKLNNQIGVSYFFKFWIKNKEELNKSLDKICEWDIKGIGMAHGEPVYGIYNGSNPKDTWRQRWDKLIQLKKK